MPDHINRYENDKLPMLSDMHTQQLDEHVETPFHQLSRKPNQSSLSIISCLPTCVENHLSKETKPGRSEKTAPSIQINDLKNESKLQGSWDPYRPTQGALENKKFSSEGFSKYHGTGKDKVVKNYYKDKNKQPLDTCPEYLDEHKASQLHWSRTWTHDMPESSEPAKNDGIAQVIPTSGLLYKGQKPQDHHTSVSGALMENNKEPSTEGFPTFNSKVRNAFLENEHDQKFKHLLKSGPLGMCHDPYCTTCPSHWNYKGAPKRKGRTDIFSPKFRDTLYGGARGWARRFGSSLNSWLPGVVNPHAKIVQQWNKFFVISCLVSIFVDPLCFFLFYARQDYKCIVLNWVMTRTIVVFRSITDFIYLLHILLQFRLAYVAPESRVVGAGDLVDHPQKIAHHYLKGYFLIDLFAVLPVPQIIILGILSKTVSLSGANYAKNLLRFAILVQYIPRLCRFLPLVVGQSPSGFIFESAWSNFMMNLLTFILAGHVVGSCWYLFGLQRVNQCIRDACHHSGIPQCIDFTDCGIDIRKFNPSDWTNWKNNANATACFNTDNGEFNYGIYGQAIHLTTVRSVITRYVYSFFWGFQQISTLAGNVVPSYFVWEVLFTMGIIGLGLLLFALLIGNMQNFLQSLGRRRLEMSLRRRDVELWMNHRRLPVELRRKVRQSVRYSWAATRGVNEAMLMEDLPEDLQREIRRHLFKFVTEVRMFTPMKETILDAICERLKQKTYITGSIILHRGYLIDKLVFIVRGKMESIGEGGHRVPLSEGDVCGEELLIWTLAKDSHRVPLFDDDVCGKELLIWSVRQSEVNPADKDKNHYPRLLSKREVACCTNVEAFILKADELAEVARVFAADLHQPCVQGAIRYWSPYCRCLAAVKIQAWWQNRMRRMRQLQIRQASSFTVRRNSMEPGIGRG